MSGFFGDEPTCRRCDYPRRLHDLLGVDHDYTPREENGPGAAATASEATNPHHTNGKKFSMKTTSGMTLSEGIAETVMMTALIKIGTEIGAGENFPTEVTFSELERFAQWAGESFEDLLQNARDAVGSSNTAWVRCTECEIRAEQDQPAEPTHVVHIDGHAHLVTVIEPGIWDYVTDLGDGIEAGIETDRRIQGAGYSRTGCWQDITQHDGLEYQLAPIKAVTK